MRIRGIDEKDNLICNLLLKNGRMSYSDIAEVVGLTRTAVKNRIKNLEEAGIIGGYRAIINPQNSSEMMDFVVNIETTAESFDEVKEKLSEAEETITVVQTTGNCHLLAICRASDIREMKAFVNGAYKELSGIRSISAHAVLDVVKGSVIPEK